MLFNKVGISYTMFSSWHLCSVINYYMLDVPPKIKPAFPAQPYEMSHSQLLSNTLICFETQVSHQQWCVSSRNNQAWSLHTQLVWAPGTVGLVKSARAGFEEKRGLLERPWDVAVNKLSKSAPMEWAIDPMGHGADTGNVLSAAKMEPTILTKQRMPVWM